MEYEMLEQYMGYGYLVAALAAYILVATRQRDKAVASAKAGVKAFSNVLVTLLSIFGLVGLMNAFIPMEVIQRWLGSGSGVVSLLTGGLLGSAAAGPPVAAYPVAQSLLDAGAWAPAVAAFIVSWTLVGFLSLPFEAKMFGTRFAVARNVISFGVSLVIGLIVGWVL